MQVKEPIHTVLSLQNNGCSFIVLLMLFVRSVAILQSFERKINVCSFNIPLPTYPMFVGLRLTYPDEKYHVYRVICDYMKIVFRYCLVG